MSREIDTFITKKLFKVVRLKLMNVNIPVK